MRRRTALLSFVVVLAACGGSDSKPLSKAAYIKDVNSITGAAANSRARFKFACQPKEPPGNDSYVFRVRFNTPPPSTLRSEASTLSSLKPPPAVAAAQRDLVQALRSLARELSPFATRSGCRGMNVKDVLASFSVSIDQLKRAHREFDHAGYKFANRIS